MKFISFANALSIRFKAVQAEIPAGTFDVTATGNYPPPADFPFCHTSGAGGIDVRIARLESKYAWLPDTQLSRSATTAEFSSSPV